MSRGFAVSRGGYYRGCKRPESKRRRDDRRLVVSIKAAHTRSKRRYGSPRVTRELKEPGQCVARHRIARLMREHGIRGRRRRRYRMLDESAWQLLG